jgi:hypothetical protein
MRMPLGAADVSQIPDDFELPVLGSAAEVRERIHQVLQAVDWDDPEWGRLEGMGWSMELNLGRDDPADSLMLHVRGGGDGAVEAVQWWRARSTPTRSTCRLAPRWYPQAGRSGSCIAIERSGSEVLPARWLQ